MTKKKPVLFAAIHLGSEQLTMQIVEYSSLEKYKILDTVVKKVRLSEETFKTGQISLNVINNICENLKGFKRLLKGYNVENYRMVATTALREAANREFVIDQIKSKTDFSLDVLDMPQEIYHKYTSINRTLKAHNVGNDGSGVLIIDISSGGLGITFIENNIVKYQKNLHLGIIRIKENFKQWQKSTAHFTDALGEYISSTISPVRLDLSTFSVQHIVLSGSETDLMLKMLGRDKNTLDTFERIPMTEFDELYKKISKLNLMQLIKVFDFPENTFDMVLPTILLYQNLLKLMPCVEIIIPPDRLIDGVRIRYIAKATNHSYVEELENSNVGLAYSLGETFNYDRAHALTVEKFAISIFQKLAPHYNLTSRQLLLLRIACILHDIGKYIRLDSHYFYSYQLILSLDIFGLSNLEKRMVALIVYHHAKSMLSTNIKHNLIALDREYRAEVAKLSAILRIADALDRSYCQKIKDLKMILKKDELVIKVKGNKDLSLEYWTFESKAEFFAQVYGIKITLEGSN